jgi:hypothetical protein
VPADPRLLVKLDAGAQPVSQLQPDGHPARVGAGVLLDETPLTLRNPWEAEPFERLVRSAIVRGAALPRGSCEPLELSGLIRLPRFDLGAVLGEALPLERGASCRQHGIRAASCVASRRTSQDTLCQVRAAQNAHRAPQHHTAQFPKPELRGSRQVELRSAASASRPGADRESSRGRQGVVAEQALGSLGAPVVGASPGRLGS